MTANKRATDVALHNDLAKKYAGELARIDSLFWAIRIGNLHSAFAPGFLGVGEDRLELMLASCLQIDWYR